MSIFLNFANGFGNMPYQIKNNFRTAALLMLAVLGLGVAPLRAVTFTAAFDRDTIAFGETATLSLTFEGGQPQTAPSPDVPGLQIVSTGNSQNFSIVNGQMSSTVTITFSVSPKRTGDFVIPAMTVDVNGQSLTSPPLKLKVVPPNSPPPQAVSSGSEAAFMRLTLAKTNVYVGEVITANIKIYLRDDVEEHGQPQISSLPADGFSIGKGVYQNAYREQIGNRVYTVIPASLALTVTRTGPVNVGPVMGSIVIVLPSSNSGSDPFFRRFFNAGDQKQISLATDAVTLNALALPKENVPANFNGAVGKYTLTVTAGPTNVAVGDPITVRVQISGRGALDALSLPDQPAWRDFKAYPPTQNVKTTDQLGIEGAKTFEQIVTPQNTDVHELPAFAFSFFDPAAGTYRTLTEPPVQLAVHSGGTTPAPVIAARENRRLPGAAATGHPAHQRAIGHARAGRPAAVDATGVSGRTKSARPRLVRRLRVAQARGQSGEQSASATAAAGRPIGPRRTV